MVYELGSVPLWLVKNLTFTKTYSNKKGSKSFIILQLFAIFVISNCLVFDVVVCSQNARTDSFYLLIMFQLPLG